MKNYIILAFSAIIAFSSCTKDDPIAEIDQEQLSSATLIFTPVTQEINNGKISYKEIEGEKIQSIKFKAPSYLPELGEHLDLHVGDTYKLELKTTDFAGRASEQTFLNRPESHQAFLLGVDNDTIEFVYGDDYNVGITAYLTVKKEGNLTLNYIMRHLNASSKSTLKSTDWNNASVKLGAVDLDLKFQAHLVDEDHGH